MRYSWLFKFTWLESVIVCVRLLANARSALHCWSIIKQRVCGKTFANFQMQFNIELTLTNSLIVRRFSKKKLSRAWKKIRFTTFICFISTEVLCGGELSADFLAEAIELPDLEPGEIATCVWVIRAPHPTLTVSHLISAVLMMVR